MSCLSQIFRVCLTWFLAFVIFNWYEFITGLYLENYITSDLRNVTLTVLEGEVLYEIEDEDLNQSFGFRLGKNESIPIKVGMFHKIHTISSTPSCYMYIYVNKTKENQANTGSEQNQFDMNRETMYSPFPLIEDVQSRMDAFLRMISHISNSFLHVLYNQPLIRRSVLNISWNTTKYLL